MKPIKIEIKNLYDGYKVGGLTLNEAMYLSDEDRLEKMITFILSRSEILIDELKQREANNNSGTMSAAATSTYRNVLIIKKNAQRVKSTMEPMAFFELGKSMEGIKTSLAVIEGFTILKRHLTGPIEGGRKNAIRAEKDNKDIRDRIKKNWRRLEISEVPEIRRAKEIASIIGLTPDQIRNHLYAMGLKTKKKRAK
jgi:hypothetical protein